VGIEYLASSIGIGAGVILARIGLAK